jgi:hypothetical protein
MQRPACGTYRLDEPLLFTSTSRADLDGGNSGCVVFNVNFPAGDIFLFNQTPRMSFRDIEVNAIV